YYQRFTDETEPGVVRDRISPEIPCDTGPVRRFSGCHETGGDRLCDRPDYRSAGKRRKEYPHLYDEQAGCGGSDYGQLVRDHKSVRCTALYMPALNTGDRRWTDG